jgi:hypothetical protein
MEKLWVLSTLNTNYYISNYGDVKNAKTGKILKPMLNHKGYYRVELSGKLYFIHRLVASAFINNKENKPQVNHIDGNKINNMVNNLEWCTNIENQRHAKENNLKKCLFGTDVYNHKINNKIALEIYNSNDSQRKIAQKYNVSQRLVLNIKKRRAWSHIHIC